MCFVAVPSSGEVHPEPGKNPYNTMIMITDAGEVNLVYRSDMNPSLDGQLASWPIGHSLSLGLHGLGGSANTRL